MNNEVGKKNKREDLKKVPREFSKYLLVGLLNNGVNFAVFSIIVYLSPPSHIIAASVGFVAGGFTNFVLNRRWTFRKKHAANMMEVGKFIAVSLSSLVINAIVVYVAVDQLKFSKNFGWLCGVGTAAVYNFILFKVWVFITPKHILEKAED